MNLNKKAESLHQSMEAWIDLYKTIHECGHNEAHDAFDEWADKLQGECADQTSNSFHEAVVASHAEMRKGFVEEHFPTGDSPYDKPADIVIMHGRTLPKSVSYTDTSGKVHTSKPIPNLVGGPLIELSYGKQPQTAIARQHFLATIGERTEVAGVSHRPVTFEPIYNPGPIGGPILDTGRDPLSFKDECDLFSQPVAEDDVANTREKAEKVIEINTSFLINTKHAHDHPTVIKAREVIAVARSFLEMLAGVEQRAKERTGKTLTLKGVILKGKK